MVIQAMCRDTNLRIANERGIEQAIYLIPINKISDIWIERYMDSKAKSLKQAWAGKTQPPVCKVKERWNNRKCLDYCHVAEHCPHGQNLKRIREGCA